MTEQLPTSALSVAPGAVRTFAADEASTADRLRAHTTGTDVSPLALTFGLIGAEFLTALGRVLDTRRARLAEVAERHEAISTDATSAASAYTAADEASELVLSYPTSGVQA